MTPAVLLKTKLIKIGLEVRPPKSQKKLSPFGNMSLNVTFVHHFLYWGIGGTLRWLLGTSGLKNPKNQDMLAKRTKNTDIPAVHVSEIPLYTHP